MQYIVYNTGRDHMTSSQWEWQSFCGHPRLQSPKGGRISVEIQEKYEKNSGKSCKWHFRSLFFFFFLDVSTFYVPSHKEVSVPTSVFPDLLLLLLLSFSLHNIVHITLSYSYAFVLNVIKFTWLNASRPVTTEGKNYTLQ